jgi:hypothetical protein
MLKDVVQSLYSGGWIANSVVGVVLFLILSGAGAVINTPKSRLYGAALGFTILFWVVIIAIGNRLPSNPPQDEPPKPIQKLSVSVEEISSQREEFPYGLAVILHTTVSISPVHIAILCSGPISDARVMFSPPPGAAAFGSSMSGKVTRIDGAVFDFSFDGPPFTPRGPLEIKLFSAQKIRLLDVKLLD